MQIALAMSVIDNVNRLFNDRKKYTRTYLARDDHDEGIPPTDPDAKKWSLHGAIIFVSRRSHPRSVRLAEKAEDAAIEVLDDLIDRDPRYHSYFGLQGFSQCEEYRAVRRLLRKALEKHKKR